MTTAKTHLWRGQWLDDSELEEALARFEGDISDLLTRELPQELLLRACDKVSAQLRPNQTLYDRLERTLQDSGAATSTEIENTLAGIAEFLKADNLIAKLKRELGSKTPFASERITYAAATYERWAPLGLLVHVAPTNAFSVGALSVVEGLLAGNVNVLKTSGKDCLFPQQLLEALGQADNTGRLRDFIMVGRISSRRSDLLQLIFAQADGVAAWGGEESVAAVKALTPVGAKFVDWGPKISFGFVAASKMDDFEIAKGLAYDVCVADQQACSSPQCIYVETTDKEALDRYAEQFAHALADVSQAMPGLQPGFQEQAEITNVTELARLGSCLGENRVIEADDKSWRVLVEYKSGLRASPLFRTVWIKPLMRQQVVTTLRPLRSYLQTVGLAGNPQEIAAVSQDMVAAGIQRITTPGAMHDSYMGEPHDGRYALQAYCRRISWQLDAQFDGIASLKDLLPSVAEPNTNVPIMTKSDFQSAQIQDEYAHLFFKSGGSSGEPKLSVFTYDDYHGQMYAAAEGLYAAGLDPVKDRCINLFFGGGLYGGFVSFFTILERLRVVQLPMASHLDFNFVVEMIKRNRVNVLLGMPSYLIQLFQSKSDELKDYAGIKKVFYGGEHFNEVQRRYLINEFGVEQVTSATYGSVDAGPLGFQCKHCQGSVHHVHNRLQHLEILKIDDNVPVDPGEAGRLIFTSKMRTGQEIQRYDIGDLGRWVEGSCGCGRQAPRFQLLGRHGDIARVGTTFVNYSKIAAIIADAFGYAGELQMVLTDDGSNELITLRLEPVAHVDELALITAVLEAYADLNEVVDEGLVRLKAVFCQNCELDRIPGSGKLRHILDERTLA